MIACFPHAAFLRPMFSPYLCPTINHPAAAVKGIFPLRRQLETTDATPSRLVTTDATPVGW